MNITQQEYDVCVYLAESIYEKYDDCITPTHSVRKLSGLRADIFELDDVNYVVFSGTNGFFAINDWISNIKMALLMKPNQFIEALEFISSELDQNKRTIFTSHSLGGAISEYVCNHIKHDNFVSVCFNGAGIRHLTKPKYHENIYHFITTRDILNRIFMKWIPFRWMKYYFKHIGKIIYIEDDISRNGIKSHSNWELFKEFKIK